MSEARFWPKVDRRGPDECWPWKAYRCRTGYGQFFDADAGFLKKAHRYSYELHLGAIPHGMHVCHRCDNPSCVNPAHLFAGTQADNMADMKEKKRANRPDPSKCTNAKFGWGCANAIRLLSATGGFLDRHLADLFGVSRPAVSKLLRGESWRQA